MHWVHCPQAVVCTPHQYQHSSHNLYLWWSSKCHQKSTPGTHGEVPRSWEVPSGLGGGPGEEHGPVGKNWGHDGVEIGLQKRGQEGGEQR